MLQIAGVALIQIFSTLSILAQTPAQAPLLELKDLQGGQLRLGDYKGRVVLINFWATWCAPCRTEVSDLVRWQQTYKNRGLQVIGITYPPQSSSEVRRFIQEHKINYPVALGTKEIKARFTSSETLPMTVVIDANGNVHEVIEGIVFADEFVAKVKPLLARQVARVESESAKPKRPQIQRATILVNAEGYQPKNVRLQRGVRARLTFIRKAEGCGTEIIIPAYGINRPLPLNVPVTVSFTPIKSGRVKLTCGMDMFRGSLVVR